MSSSHWRLAAWIASALAVPAAGALAQTEDAAQPRTIEVGRIEGSVRYRDGRPLVGAQVTVSSMRQDAPNGGFSQARFGPTGLRADGTFAIDAVPVGDATIMVAMPPDSQIDARAPRDRPPRTFWQQVKVSATETTIVSLVNREVVLSGRVLRSGQPGQGLKVSHSGQGHWLRPMAAIRDAPAGLIGESVATEPDGSFTLILPGPGPRTLQVSTTDDRTRFYASVDAPEADVWEQDLTVGGLAVAGIVVDQRTGRPVKQATVYTAVGRAFPETRANDKGRFVLELPPGEYRVGAFLRDSPYLEARDVPLVVGEAAGPELRVPLVREPSIDGRVLGQKGRPVEGAFVSACRSGETRPGRPYPVLHLAQRSAADGAFHIVHLEKAAYSLAAHGPDGSLAFRAGITSGTADASLVLQAPVMLPLRIVDGSGRPAGGALVTVEAIDGAPPCGVGSAPADPGGLARLRLPAAAKSIDVFVRQGTGALSTAVPIGTGGEVRLELAETAATTRAATIDARGRLEGTVRDRDGTPIAGAEVTFFRSSGRDFLPQADSHGPTPAGEDGTFTLDAVPTGYGSIRVVPPPGICAETRTRRCPFWKRVKIAESGTTTVSLVDPAVILTGRVFRSGRAEKGVKVSYSRTGLWPPEDRLSPIRAKPVTVETGPDGAYRLVLPYPGRARLRISTPDASEHFPAQVDVRDVATHVQDLRVGDAPPTPEARALPTEANPAIEGRTVGQDGSPMSGPVRACPEDKTPGARYQTGSNLPDGAFSFRDLGTGGSTPAAPSYTLVATGPDGSLAYQRGIPAGTNNVTLALDRPAEVTLRILDARGEPAAGTWVRVEAIDGASPCEIGSPPADKDGVATLRLPAATKAVDVMVYGKAGKLREILPLDPEGRREVVLRLVAP